MNLPFTAMAVGVWCTYPLLWAMGIKPNTFTAFWAAFWTILAVIAHMMKRC